MRRSELVALVAGHVASGLVQREQNAALVASQAVAIAERIMALTEESRKPPSPTSLPGDGETS